MNINPWSRSNIALGAELREIIAYLVYVLLFFFFAADLNLMNFLLVLIVMCSNQVIYELQ